MNRKEIILEQLSAMGFEPVEFGDAAYLFRYEDICYMYIPDEDDEQFLRIAIPYLFEVNDENRVAAMEATHDTTMLIKYSKVCIMYETSVWAMYEHRLNSTDNLAELLEHIIRVLETTYLVFQKKINGEDIMECLKNEEDNDSDKEIEIELQKILNSIDDETEVN